MKNKIIKIIGNLIMLVTILFIAKALLSFDIDYLTLLKPRYALYILLLVIFYLFVNVFVNAYGWKIVLEFLSHKRIPFPQGLHVYAKANLGKYLPGNIMHYVNRQIFANSLGLAQVEVAISSIIELGGVCATGLFWSICLSWEPTLSLIRQYYPTLNIFLFVIGIFVLILLILVICWLLSRKVETIGRIFLLFKSPKFFLLILKLFAIYTLNFGSLGTMLVLLLGWSTDITWSVAATVISASILSWLIGFIVPGVPGGLGVREAVLVLLLSGVCGQQVVLLAAVLQRFVIVLSELGGYALSIPISHKYVSKPQLHTIEHQPPMPPEE